MSLNSWFSLLAAGNGSPRARSPPTVAPLAAGDSNHPFVFLDRSRIRRRRFSFSANLLSILLRITLLAAGDHTLPSSSSGSLSPSSPDPPAALDILKFLKDNRMALFSPLDFTSTSVSAISKMLIFTEAAGKDLPSLPVTVFCCRMSYRGCCGSNRG